MQPQPHTQLSHCFSGFKALWDVLYFTILELLVRNKVRKAQQFLAYYDGPNLLPLIREKWKYMLGIFLIFFDIWCLKITSNFLKCLSKYVLYIRKSINTSSGFLWVLRGRCFLKTFDINKTVVIRILIVRKSKSIVYFKTFFMVIEEVSFKTLHK